jgi:hypothetical protein
VETIDLLAKMVRTEIVLANLNKSQPIPPLQDKKSHGSEKADLKILRILCVGI